MHCQVIVPEGSLKGKVCSTPCGKKYYSFEGIPYAKPPIGPLRFKAPEKCDDWSGVLDATKPGNKCVQMNLIDGSIEGSEDCLYLNIYTPSLPYEKIQKLPVLFFIHGGRFLMGYGDYYRPDYLIRHDVILVTINYRLTIFGFLCLHTREVPGNAGLKDTAMALKWVQSNIEHFNGDINNIVAFGESAGAAVALSFLNSKMINGISKIIAQSGTSLSDLFMVDDDPVERAKAIGTSLSHEVRNTGELYDLLINASAEDLIGAYMSQELGREITTIHAYLLPVVEKQFENTERYFDEYPLQSIRNNRCKNIPCLMSMATHEAALFLNRDDSGNIIFTNNLRKFIPNYAFVDLESKEAYNIERVLKKLYFKDKEIGPSTLPEYLKLTSDAYFARDFVYTAEILSSKCSFYLCRFDYPGNMNTRIMKKLGVEGTTHGDLIQYVFYKEKKAKSCKDSDRAIIDMLCEMWCNFAKTGKPSWKHQNTKWLPYKKSQKLCLNIAENNIQCIPLPEFSRNKVWIDLVCQRSKL
ncbi:unnamed protein product [Pieris macdunnoughi]|uniref:Carboxylesterase type B domain-containing protein n=1 Tax=Pieris macdunnoughi TaxID=345717 RepID=A0A821UAU9_9NEOP|nr:unnamed protein product [Pieris macdunnoughi]